MHSVAAFRLIYFAFFLCLVSACTKKTPGLKNPHAGAREGEPAVQSDHSEGHSYQEDLLDGEYLSQVGMIHNESERIRLRKINSNILAGQSDEELKDKYKRAIFYSCDEKLRGCQALSFFKSESSSSRVAVYFAEKESNVNDYYRWLKLAFDLNNGEVHPELVRAFVLRSHEISDKSEKFLGKLRLAIKEVGEKGALDQSFLARSKSENPWSIVRDGNGRLNPFDQKYLMWAARSWADKSSDVKESLSQQIKKDQDKEGSFVRAQKKLENLNVFLEKDFGSNISKIDDIRFFLVDRIFQKQLNFQDALQIWGLANLEVEGFGETIKGYLMTRLLEFSYKANAKLLEVFEESEGSRNKVDVDALYNRAVNLAPVVRSVWSDFKFRSASTRSFLEHLAVSYPNAEAEVRKSLEVIRSLDKSIVYLSEYPHTFFVAYELTRRGFKLPLSGGDLDGSYFISHFFDGEYQPWFDYTDDTEKLDRIEVAFSIALAMRSGFFESMGKKRLDVVKNIVKFLKRQDKKMLEKNVEVLREELSGGQFQTILMPLCKTIREESGEKIQTNIASLQQNVLGGSWFDRAVQHDQLSPLSKNNIDDYLEYASVEMKSRDLAIDMLFRELGTVAKDEDLLLVRQEREKVDRAAKLFFTSVYDLQSKYIDCILTVFKEVFRLELAVYRGEEENLRKAHALMFEKQGRGSSKAEHVYPRGHFKLVPNYLPEDVVTDDKLILKHKTALLRARTHLVGNGSTFEVKEGAAAPYMNIDAPKNFENFKRAQKLLQDIPVPYHQNVEIFVQRGMNLLFNNFNHQDKGFFRWANLGSKLIIWKDIISSLAKWYKMGPVPIFANGWAHNCLSPEIDCGESKTEISLARLIEASKSVWQIVSMSDEEKKYYEMQGRKRKIRLKADEIRVHDLFLDFTTGKVAGLMDFVTYAVRSPRLGPFFESAGNISFVEVTTKVLGIDQSNVFTIAEDFMRRKVNRYHLFFSKNDTAVKFVENSIRSNVTAEINNVFSFFREIDCREKEFLSDSRTYALTLSDEANTWVNPRIISNYQGFIKRFLKVVDGFVSAESLDLSTTCNGGTA